MHRELTVLYIEIKMIIILVVKELKLFTSHEVSHVRPDFFKKHKFLEKEFD